MKHQIGRLNFLHGLNPAWQVLGQSNSRIRPPAWGVGLVAAALPGTLQSAQATGVQIARNLANLDVRHPPSLPNDLEIIAYGAGLTHSDVQFG